MNIYSDKLAHILIQVVINCRYSVAQMCTRDDTLAHILGTPYIDDFMKHIELTTIICKTISLKSHTQFTIAQKFNLTLYLHLW